jgi:pyrroline-5-carboxylate reductase
LLGCQAAGTLTVPWSRVVQGRSFGEVRTAFAPTRAAANPDSVHGMTGELVVLGGGRMGEALVAGLITSGWAAAQAITIVEALPIRRGELEAGLAARYPGLVVTDVVPQVAAGAVVAVKPPDVQAACAALASADIGRVLSIAAGVPLARLEAWLSRPAAVIRAMPNTPALVGAGASAVAAGRGAGPDDLAWASGILAAVGTVVTVPEYLIDAVTGLSGSGPAYVFLVAEALTDAGVLVGLPRATASALVVQTILGSARLMAETGETPEALRAAVTSPAGTTAAGLLALERAGVRAALLDAVAAATERSRQLGEA